jgi:hypothetical protein
MKTTPTKKTFDCLAYKDRVQAEIYEEIKHLTIPEQVEYFRREAESGPFGEWLKTLKARPATSAGTESGSGTPSAT